jgi:archaellum biogenesis ATPase FlaH
MNLTPYKLPACLTERRQWVLWKTIDRSGEPTKVPFQVNGEPAKSSDAQTWDAFDMACQRHEQGGYDGIGYVLDEHDPFCGIDLDGCRNPETKQVAEWAREIIKRFDSYTEISPSGTGVKIFIRGCLPFGHRNKVKVDAESVSTKTPGIEVYDNRRYFACTGWRIAGISQEVEEREEAMLWLAEKYLPIDCPTTPEQNWHAPDAVIERARRYLTKMPGAVSGQHGHDRTFHAACVLVKGFGLSEDQALPLMMEWGETCQPPWKERDIRHKLADSAKQSGEVNYLRNAKPDRWESISVPSYQAPAQPVRSEPEIQTLEDATKKYVVQLSTSKTSLIELGLPDVDYALGGGVELGEMVILAARPSHGKSAVALQCIHHLTANGYPAVFISEEMSDLAIGKRVIQFASDVPQEHWRTSLNNVTKDVEYHFKDRAACVMVQSCGTTQRATDAIRKAVDTHQVKIAVVDYAQLLTSSGKSRYEQITNTSIALRQLASELKIVLLVLCQLSREIEKRIKFVPQTSDLKDTGQLEQDADVILFLVWPHKINKDLPANEYQFYVGKNRNRAINEASVKCRFHPSRQMFMPEKSTTKRMIDPFSQSGTEWTGQGEYTGTDGF